MFDKLYDGILHMLGHMHTHCKIAVHDEGQRAVAKDAIDDLARKTKRDPETIVPEIIHPKKRKEFPVGTVLCDDPGPKNIVLVSDKGKK